MLAQDVPMDELEKITVVRFFLQVLWDIPLDEAGL